MLHLRRRRRTIANYKTALGGFTLALGLLGTYSSLTMLQMPRQGEAGDSYVSNKEAPTDPSNVSSADVEMVVSLDGQNNDNVSDSVANPQAVNVPVQSTGMRLVQSAAPAHRSMVGSGAIAQQSTAAVSLAQPVSVSVLPVVPAPDSSPAVEPAETPPSPPPVVVTEPSVTRPIDVVSEPATEPVELPVPAEVDPSTPPEPEPNPAPAGILQPSVPPDPVTTSLTPKGEPALDGVMLSTPVVSQP